MWRGCPGEVLECREAPLPLAAQSHLEGQLVCIISMNINAFLAEAGLSHEAPAGREPSCLLSGPLIRMDVCMTLKIQAECSHLSPDRYLVLKLHSAEAAGGHIANSLV